MRGPDHINRAGLGAPARTLDEVVAEFCRRNPGQTLKRSTAHFLLERAQKKIARYLAGDFSYIARSHASAHLAGSSAPPRETFPKGDP